MKRLVPFEVAPGTSATLECTVETFQPGEFQSGLTIYADDNGLREIFLMVRGVASAAKTKKG